MTLKEIRAYIKMELEFEFPDWMEIKRLANEAIYAEDNQDYGYEPKEK
jgi:hypothetical protein